MFKGNYPEIQFHIGNGDIVTIPQRPRRHELKDNEMLTGEFRVPRKGEYYWYPKDKWYGVGSYVKPSDSTGRVSKCGGNAIRRFHIIRKIMPRMAVWNDCSQGWAEIDIDSAEEIVKGL